MLVTILDTKGPKPVKKSHFLIIVIHATLASIVLTLLIRSNYQFFLDLVFPIPPFVSFPYNLVGLLFILVGAVLIIWANYTLFYVGKIGFEDREPFHVPYKLVQDGPYKFSRNPIYLAGILLILGLGVIIGSITVLFSAIIVFIILRFGLIKWEEKNLEKAFGDDYIAYKKRVRRWL